VETTRLTEINMNRNRNLPSQHQSDDGAQLSIELSNISSFSSGWLKSPVPVLAAFGTGTLHGFDMPPMKWDIDSMVKELGSRIVRSDSTSTDGPDDNGWIDVIFHFKGLGAFIHYESGRIRLYAATRSKILKIAPKLNRYSIPKKESGGSFELIRSIKAEENATETITLEKNTILDGEELNLQYGKDFSVWAEVFACNIAEKPSGLSILEGRPGTGKTSFLRHLMGVLKESHKFYFVPPSVVGVVSQPEFIGFWQEQHRRHRAKKFILVLEDADDALMIRSNDNRTLVSSILNITDGLLADFLKLQVICTINCKSDEIDQALLRPGRLLTHRIFGRLGYEDAQRLSEKLGRKLHLQKDYSLAEIFNTPADDECPDRKVGFAA
jgi:hypothetical protein